VYIEEVDTGSHPIEGVPTDRAVLVGVAPTGPWTPTFLTSLTDYERAYGAAALNLNIGQALHGFFANGGTRCYVLHLHAPAPPGAIPASQLLSPLDSLTDVSMVTCPDEHFLQGMTAALVAHCETHRDRIAILGSILGGTYTNDPPPQAQSEFAAFYAPWVLVPNPAGGAAIPLHPGGHVAGAIASNDTNRGVWHAPANIVLMGITGLEQQIPAPEATALNDRGVNVLRNLPPGGNRIWGARTTSADEEWKYLSIRRYLIFLEQSMQQGLQWAVFEPNGEVLWASVRQAVENFLLNEYLQGALQGTTPQQAFFVRCDLTTMTQADIDNGQVNCLVGVAPARPAEFIIFQIAIVTSNQ
jgi:phage tail sheath protein FI